MFAHHGATTQAVNRMTRDEGFMACIVDEDDQASRRQKQIMLLNQLLLPKALPLKTTDAVAS